MGFFIIIAFLYNNKKIFYKIFFLIAAHLFLIGYFIFTGRFIQRIEWIIIINILFSFLLLLLDFDFSIISNKKEIILLGILLNILLFGVQIPASGAARWNDIGGKNTYKQYKYIIAKSDNYWHYLYNQKRGNNYQYKTYNSLVSEDILKDKSSFYFVLYTNTWRQPFPLVGKDMFRTAQVGTASNWGVLGEYTVGLKPIQRNLSTYNIKNPFRDLIKNYIKIVVRKSELFDRTNEIYLYIKERYYPDICFSIYKKYNDTVVGKYLIPFDDRKMETTEKDIGLLYGDSSINNFFSIKVLEDYNNYKEKYLQLEDSRGKRYAFIFEKDNNVVTFYKDLLDSEEKYTVKIVLLNNDNKYNAIKLNKKIKFSKALYLNNIK